MVSGSRNKFMHYLFKQYNYEFAIIEQVRNPI